MEEIVRAFNYVIEKGWALYWGTSAWPAQQIEEAHRTHHSIPAHISCLPPPPPADIATKLNLIPPIAEQMLHK